MCDALSAGSIYKLNDIYSLKIDGRLAIVGGVVQGGDNVSNVVYVWMPTSLVKNFNEDMVRTVGKSVAAGKVARFVYKGMKAGKYGKDFYDAEWVKTV